MQTTRNHTGLFMAILVLAGIVILSFFISDNGEPVYLSSTAAIADSNWEAPSLFTDGSLRAEERELVIYGEELIAHTSKYLGPRGTISSISNGMNCQNCHLNSGKKSWGNNYAAVQSTYPMIRSRSGKMTSVASRINGCFQRSLNGQPLDTNSHEMKALLTYMKWLGQGVQKGKKPAGNGIRSLAYLARSASPAAGEIVFNTKCASCHGSKGEGVMNLTGTEYEYPPLWGPHSYNIGAGLYRLSRFAGYVKDNMPFNQASHDLPALSDEEAWDVAAFVNSQPRPSKDLSLDWPDIAKKPIDHPFGPYADPFPEKQHKYGPFQPIADWYKSNR